MDTTYDELNDARFISRDDIPTNIDIVTDCDTSDIDMHVDEPFIYTDDEIKEAQQFGVTVEELFKIYEEINNYEPDEPSSNCEEWPVLGWNGYEDEGLEESMH